MDFVETEGDTIDAAIENALRLLRVEREKITVEIISEGRKGILGFGSQKAKIRAELRKSVISLKPTEPRPIAPQAAARSVGPYMEAEHAIPEHPSRRRTPRRRRPAHCCRY